MDKLLLLTIVRELGAVGVSFRSLTCLLKCKTMVDECRSISLVGEGERKMLKEVVKRAKVPAKSRLIPQDVVVRYRDKIRKLSPEIKAILKEEKEEKEVYVSIAP